MPCSFFKSPRFRGSELSTVASKPPQNLYSSDLKTYRQQITVSIQLLRCIIAVGSWLCESPFSMISRNIYYFFMMLLYFSPNALSHVAAVSAICENCFDKVYLHKISLFFNVYCNSFTHSLRAGCMEINMTRCMKNVTCK